MISRGCLFLIARKLSNYTYVIRQRLIFAHVNEKTRIENNFSIRVLILHNKNL